MGDAIVRKTDAEIVYDKAKSVLERNEQKIKDALPEIMRANAADFQRALMVDLHKNEKLAKAAAQNPIGFVACVLDGARTGLRFGPFGHLNVLPFWNKKEDKYEMSLVIGYKGYNELALASGKVKGLTKHCVFEGEPFELLYGTEERLYHQPRWDIPRTLDTCIGAYATAKMASGEVLFKFMTKDEIFAVSKDNAVWRDNWEAMFEKTPLRRLANLLPMTPEFQQAIEIEDSHAKRRYDAFEATRPERGAALTMDDSMGALGPAQVQDRDGQVVDPDPVADPVIEHVEGDDSSKNFAEWTREKREGVVEVLLKTRVFDGDVEASVKQLPKLTDAKLSERYEKLNACKVKE